MNNKEVAKLATKALLYEVTISPKAGLVSRLSNGSHRDMDFYTFIDSALSLNKYFSECFIYGQENNFYSPNFFKNLRDLGKKKKLKKKCTKLQMELIPIKELFFQWEF